MTILCLFQLHDESEETSAEDVFILFQKILRSLGQYKKPSKTAQHVGKRTTSIAKRKGLIKHLARRHDMSSYPSTSSSSRTSCAYDSNKETISRIKKVCHACKLEIPSDQESKKCKTCNQFSHTICFVGRTCTSCTAKQGIIYFLPTHLSLCLSVSRSVCRSVGL